jgi:hypothetical protein
LKKKSVLPTFWRRNKNVILSDSEESANQRRSVAYFSSYLPIEADSSNLRSSPSPPGLEKFRIYVKSAKKTDEPKNQCNLCHPKNQRFRQKINRKSKIVNPKSVTITSKKHFFTKKVRFAKQNLA